MEPSALQSIVDDLADRYGGAFTREEIEVVVTDSHDELSKTSRSAQYLPVFVRRFAKERLVGMAEGKGMDRAGMQDVLFVCNGNAGRSQMAAALANDLAQGRIRAWSAGVDPMSEVLPQVVEVMRERGIDMSDTFPKPMTGDVTRAAEYIVAIGVVDSDLPAHGRQVLHWDIPPVVGQDVQATRAARDALEGLVRELPAEIVPARES